MNNNTMHKLALKTSIIIELMAVLLAIGIVAWFAFVPRYQSTSISLERTICFGFCPAYVVTLHEDGSVVYEGYAHVAVEGKQQSTISVEQFQSLEKDFDDIDFFSLNDDYIDPLVTDLPSAVLTFTKNGKTKTVTHYYGDPNPPEALTALEEKIDEVTNTAQWIEEPESE